MITSGGTDKDAMEAGGRGRCVEVEEFIGEVVAVFLSGNTEFKSRGG